MKKELKSKDIKNFSRDEVKAYGFKRFLNSVKYSFQGLAYSYRFEQSCWIHALFTMIGIALGIIFRIKLSEWALLFIALGAVLSLELMNTAIEAAVDLTTTEIHPLAKIAKDCGSAATFVMSIVSAVISLFVFGPYFVDFFTTM